MTEFPTTITYADTGERRYPDPGELYIWRSPRSDYISPLCESDNDGGYSWAFKPEHYAIYRRLA